MNFILPSSSCNFLVVALASGMTVSSVAATVPAAPPAKATATKSITTNTTTTNNTPAQSTSTQSPKRKSTSTKAADKPTSQAAVVKTPKPVASKKTGTDKTTTKAKAAQPKNVQTTAKAIIPSKPDPLPEITIGELNCTPSPVSAALGINHYRFAETAPKTLTKVNGFLVHKDAAPKLKAMLAAAKKDGIILKLGSGFRSVQYQHDIVVRKKKAKLADDKIYYLSSPAGYSEHHTGFAIDFAPIDPSFGKDKKGKATKAYTWLQQHAQTYGFSQTYTAEIAKANNIAEETWHWKFTDSPTAKQMLINSACYATLPTQQAPTPTDAAPSDPEAVPVPNLPAVTSLSTDVSPLPDGFILPPSAPLPIPVPPVPTSPAAN